MIPYLLQAKNKLFVIIKYIIFGINLYKLLYMKY
jgi:hypothetical protein